MPQPSIHVRHYGGAGTPLLLLHGVLRSGTSFETVIEQLKDLCDIFALDFRGHGQSSRAPGRYRVIDYIDDAIHVLEGEVPRPAIIYGHSLGAMVATALAANRPELVKAIVLEDPPFDTMGRELRISELHAYFSALRPLAGSLESVEAVAARIAQITYQGKTLSEVRSLESIRFTAQSLQEIDPAVFDPMLDGTWLHGYDTESLVSRISCPTLALQADPACGGMLTTRMAEKLTGGLSNARVAFFPGAAHQIHWTHPTALIEAVRPFLESL